jgi:hypothetical protein
MNRVLFFISVIFILASGCKDNILEKKANSIKNYSIQDSIYEKGFIYMTSNNKLGNNIEYPNVKLFDKNGLPLDVGSCMNAIEKIVTQVAEDSFPKVVLKTVKFNEYVENYQLISIDNLNAPIIDMKYDFYICYNWNHSLQFFNHSEDYKSIFRKMKNAQMIATKNNIKLILIHFP